MRAPSLRQRRRGKEDPPRRCLSLPERRWSADSTTASASSSPSHGEGRAVASWVSFQRELESGLRSGRGRYSCQNQVCAWGEACIRARIRFACGESWILCLTTIEVSSLTTTFFWSSAGLDRACTIPSRLLTTTYYRWSSFSGH
jgi:hypothetical protein